MFRRLAKQILVVALASTVALTAAAQQIPVTGRDAAIKRKADALKPQAKITVILLSGGEEFGSFISNDSRGITFLDVDRGAQVVLNYSDVKKIKDGYGGRNSITQRHTDHTKAVVVTVVVLGALGGLIAAATAARN